MAWAARCAGLGDALKRYTDEQKRIAVVMVDECGSVAKVGVASDPKRVGPASRNLEYG